MRKNLTTAILAATMAAAALFGLSGSSVVHAATTTGLAAHAVSVPAGATTAGGSAERHHLAVVHNQALVHADHVRHALRLRALWENELDLRQAHPGGPDYWTTNTADWWCIRVHEEGGAQAPSNEFGFVPYNYGMSASAQSALALSILNNYGWGAWSTAPGCGL